MMKITTKKWIRKSESAPDIGTYVTDVIVRDGSILLLQQVHGYMTRKEAILAAAKTLQQSGQWGMDFIRAMWALADRKKS